MLDEPTPSPLPPLEPALQDAEQLLRESLTEVCHTDPTAADTGEMIRLDEMLAIAGEAAKRAVSLRRRMRQEGRAAPRPTKSPRRAAGPRAAGGSTAEGAAAATPRPGARKSATSRSSATIEDAAATASGAADTDAAAAETPAATTTPPATPLASSQATPLASSQATPADMREPGTPRASIPTPTTGLEGTALASSGSEHRTFRDANGVVWSVWAVHPQEGTRRAGLRGTFVQGWLAFVCESEKRRLSPVPDGWLEAEDAELERLCGTAEVAKPEALTRRMPPIRDDESPRA